MKTKAHLRRTLSLILTVAMVASALALSMTGLVSLASPETLTAQHDAQTAVNNLAISSDVTETDFETAAMNAAGAGYTVTWLQPLTVIRAMDGVVVSVNNGSGVYEEKGRVNPHNGSATGLLQLTKGGESAVITIGRMIAASLDETTYRFEENEVSEITTSTHTDVYSTLNKEGNAKLVIVRGGQIYNNLINYATMMSSAPSAQPMYDSIKAVVFLNTTNFSGWNAVRELPNLEVLVLPNSITTAGMPGLANGCAKLKHVELGSTYGFGAGVFENCISLTDLYVNNSGVFTMG